MTPFLKINGSDGLNISLWTSFWSNYINIVIRIRTKELDEASIKNLLNMSMGRIQPSSFPIPRQERFQFIFILIGQTNKRRLPLLNFYPLEGSKDSTFFQYSRKNSLDSTKEAMFLFIIGPNWLVSIYKQIVNSTTELAVPSISLYPTFQCWLWFISYCKCRKYMDKMRNVSFRGLTQRRVVLWMLTLY